MTRDRVGAIGVLVAVLVGVPLVVGALVGSFGTLGSESASPWAEAATARGAKKIRIA